MVGVTAFVGLDEDDFGPIGPELDGDASSERHQIEAGFLIGDAEDLGPNPIRLPRLEGCAQFEPSRRGIIGDLRKPVRHRIDPVVRCAVGDLHQERIAKPAQLRTHPDRFVIGVRHYDHDLDVDGMALGKSAENGVCLPWK